MDFDELPLTVPLWGTNGWGAAARYIAVDLPPEPAAPAIVRVRVCHPVYGSNPLYQRLVERWIPTAYIPRHPVSWAVLCGWDVDRHPQLLVEAAP